MESKLLRLTHPVIPTITFTASQSYHFNGKCYQNKNQEMMASWMPYQWWFKMFQREFPHQQGLGLLARVTQGPHHWQGPESSRGPTPPHNPNPAAWQPRKEPGKQSLWVIPGQIPTWTLSATQHGDSQQQQLPGHTTPAGKVWGGFPPGHSPEGLRGSQHGPHLTPWLLQARLPLLLSLIYKHKQADFPGCL